MTGGIDRRLRIECARHTPGDAILPFQLEYWRSHAEIEGR